MDKVLVNLTLTHKFYGRAPYFAYLFVLYKLTICGKKEKSKMSQPIRGQGGHLVFPIGPKNTNLVEDVQILGPSEKQDGHPGL